MPHLWVAEPAASFAPAACAARAGGATKCACAACDARERAVCDRLHELCAADAVDVTLLDDPHPARGG
eukprot:gene14979-18313_t